MVALERLPETLVETIETELSRARFGIVEATPEARPRAVLVGVASDVVRHLQDVRLRLPDAAIIAIVPAGGNAANRLLEAFRAGAHDAILAAGGFAKLVPTMKLAIERRRIEKSDGEMSRMFARNLGERARSLRDAFDRMEIAYEDTLHALVKALDVREKATAGHSVRVTLFTCYLARLLDYPESGMQDVYRGALLHDIGKIGIPDAILLKPGKLTESEFDIMKTHTSLARSFLQHVSYLENAVDIPISHHERWDGTGYPNGIGGSDIPLAARVFAVADVYDALRSRRSYKEPFDYQKTRAIIDEGVGSHFDPDVYAVFAAQSEETWDQLARMSRKKIDFRAMMDICDRLVTRGTLVGRELGP